MNDEADGCTALVGVRRGRKRIGRGATEIVKANVLRRKGWSWSKGWECVDEVHEDEAGD